MTTTSDLVKQSGANLNSIMLFVITGVMGFVAYTTNQSSIEIAKQGERIIAIERRITERDGEAYTKSQANAQHSLLEQRIERVETWTQNLSDRLRNTEEFLREHVNKEDTAK